ncbi:hypothetical protein MTO96_007855 [Rhipicephalus appendiculatus]
MTSVDLDRLCSRLSSLNADQLYCQDDEILLSTPKVRGMALPVAVSTLRAHMEAIPNFNECVNCVASVYTCLMAKQLIGPWVLYRIDHAQGVNRNDFVTRFKEAMQCKGETAYSCKIRLGRTYACVLVPESENSGASHEVCCLCLWSFLACVAVYKPPEGHSERQRQALREVLRDDPDIFMWGEFSDLDAAQRAALKSV